jgi:hypothetical protein
MRRRESRFIAAEEVFAFTEYDANRTVLVTWNPGNDVVTGRSETDHGVESPSAPRMGIVAVTIHNKVVPPYVRSYYD